jgi:hypothetical protein
MEKILKVIFPLLFICLLGCEQVLIERDPANNAVENFDLLWHTVDEKYSYFTYKNIDWDSAYAVYRPLVYDEMPKEELFTLMSDMLNILEDGHVNLKSPFNVSRNWNWYLDYPQNFDFSLLERNYLGTDYEITGPFRNTKLGDAGYLYYGSFMNDFSDTQMNHLIEKFKNCKVIIIDIRNNGGGRIDLIPRLTSFFMQEEQGTGYIRYKNGPGHNDFTTYYPQVVEPAENTFSQPVILLTNRSVYSAANAFASYMSALPNVTLMGDQTGGGGGAPFSGELMNGWRFRFSTTQILDVDKNQIEDGVPVDVRQDLLPSDREKGIDSILERALNYFE